MNLAKCQAILEAARWKFAKTMKRWPHFHTHTRDWEDSELLRDCARFIRETCPVEFFKDNPKWPRHYLRIGGWTYWSMDDDVADVHLINRERTDPAERVVPDEHL